MRWASRLFPVLLLVAALGCHHRRENDPHEPDTLTQEEMLANHFTNLHDAISALRANWLVVRGTDSFVRPSQVMVYFDLTRLGGVSELRGVTVNTVMWARHYSAVDATMRWGVGHGAGVILLSSHQ